MSTHSSARQTAEAKFAAKQMRDQEARRAMSEYEADSRRVDEKTARLRAMRLAKEAADKAAAEAQPPVVRRPAKRRSRAADRQSAGRRPISSENRPG